MNPTPPEATDLVVAARGLGPLILDSRDESERERRLPASVLSAMQRAQLFRMYVPVEYGGLETDPILAVLDRTGDVGFDFDNGQSPSRGVIVPRTLGGLAKVFPMRLHTTVGSDIALRTSPQHSAEVDSLLEGKGLVPRRAIKIFWSLHPLGARRAAPRVSRCSMSASLGPLPETG